LLNAKPVDMPYTKLARAKLQPGLCSLHYPISTRSAECQKFFDQGLGYWYSYVWTESARSFETAIKHDPDCAMAWWGLSRALDEWSKGKSKANAALKRAFELRHKASHAERQLIIARATEKGIAPDAPKENAARREAARKIIDDLLLLHPEDEEAWMARGLIASEGRTFGGTKASAPFYHALVRLNPLHPGGNHELLHQYENSERPALGWLYSEKFIESSPGIPHAWHMQGHLATRLGRWEKAAERSVKASALQRTFNREWNVKANEDHQWSHHLETCLVILTHQGRFREAHAIYDEMKAMKFDTPDAFAKLFLARKQFDVLLKLAEEQRTKNKQSAAYFAALAYLHQGATEKAQAEIKLLEEAADKPARPRNRPDAGKGKPVESAKPGEASKPSAAAKPAEVAKPVEAKAADPKAVEAKPAEAKPAEVAKTNDGFRPGGRRTSGDQKLKYRLQETKGLLLCKTGQIDSGLSYLQQAAEASKADYGQHAWGHGAYYLEVWGLAALQTGRDAIAEEAFLEALAHDPGSFRGALGLLVLAERQGKTDEAKQYLAMAERAWQNAEVKDFLAELTAVRQLKPQTSVTNSAGR
jgi:pentatricopeptide repeat protein